MQQSPTIPQPPAYGPEEQESSDSWKNRSWLTAASTIALLVAAPLLALALTAFVFQSYEVEGPSMENTLQNQDRLIVLKVPRTVAKVTKHAYIPKRGDIVIFVKHGLTEFGEAQPDKQLIKRVIGLPGEHVVVADGKITVYNEEHPEGFNPDTNGGYGNLQRLTPGNVDVVVPEGQIFVCGDNRTNSLDSRIFGPIPAKDLVGKLVVRLLPVNKTEIF